MNFENTKRGDLFKQLIFSSPQNKTTIEIIYEALINLEQENTNLNQEINSLKNSFILNIIKTLSPPNNESPQEHHERCHEWLKQFKKINNS